MKKDRHSEKFTDPDRAPPGPKLVEALRMVREGRWTVRRAAKFAGVTYHEILDRMAEFGIDSGLTLDELEEEVLPFLEKLKAGLSVKDRTRPKKKGPSAADGVREMRRKRFESLSG